MNRDYIYNIYINNNIIMINININIDENKFLMLTKIKDNNFNDIILKLLEIGYDIYFPKKELLLNSIDNNILLDKLNKLDISDKINVLENTLSKLIGFSNNSIKKGNIAENILENIFSEKYGDIIYEKMNHVPHSGDAWLILNNNKKIIIESKNYTTTINKDEINKLQYDMIYNNIKWGLLVSLNSSIQGVKDLDIITFIHNNENYTIITISNLINDLNKLDLSIQILRKLIITLDDYKSFPWILKDITYNLNELNEIINKNYILRDQFYILEKDIHKSLNLYYTILRDYQYDLDKKINNIIIKIQNSMEESINIINDNDIIYNKILSLYKSKKIFLILSKLLDVLKIKNCKLIDSSDNEYYIINYNNNDIGKIRIQLKKIIIIFFISDFIINLHIDTEKSNIYNLNIINNYIFSIL